MAKSRQQLPPLAFGQNLSKIDLDLHQMQSRVNSMTNWVSEYDELNTDLEFQHRTSVFASEGVRLIAVSSSPTVMKVNDPDCTIAIPINGSIEAWIGNGHFEPETGKQAMFFPKGKRHAEGGTKSTLLISVSEQRLNETAQIMLGERHKDQFDIFTPRIVDTKFQNVDFRKIIGQFCTLIDQFGGDKNLLRSFSVDENIVRSVVMMLAPNQFFKDNSYERRVSSKNDTIKFLCEFMSENLSQTINLTLLESVSGLSARMLQIEFQKAFQCSPLQWLKSQRLSVARQMLMNPKHGETVSRIAAECGYSNFSDFANQYFQRFAELPSNTLKRSI